MRWPRVHARWVYDTLMQCTAATLTEFAANPRWLGGIGAFTLVLHTWTQDLRRHLHVHALMACGALRTEAAATRWVEPKRSRSFLFPVHALSRVFRGKFLRRAATSRAQPASCRAIRPTRRWRRAAARAGDCAVTTGWCTPRRRWPDRRRCWTT